MDARMTSLQIVLGVFGLLLLSCIACFDFLHILAIKMQNIFLFFKKKFSPEFRSTLFFNSGRRNTTRQNTAIFSFVLFVACV